MKMWAFYRGGKWFFGHKLLSISIIFEKYIFILIDD